VRQRTVLEEGWKTVAALSRDVSDTLTAVVPIKDLAEWVRMRRRIAAAVPVRTLQVQTVEESRAIVVLQYVGTRAQLDKAFERLGLSLIESGGELSIVNR
ncbi:MAG: hypothetical protein KIT36_14590, partial [Alphaproteobacteria bacterium]|nr:hypothetical protein [Alphaproteobacteria bacterium]